MNDQNRIRLKSRNRVFKCIVQQGSKGMTDEAAHQPSCGDIGEDDGSAAPRVPRRDSFSGIICLSTSMDAKRRTRALTRQVHGR